MHVPTMIIHVAVTTFSHYRFTSSRRERKSGLGYIDLDASSSSEGSDPLTNLG